MLMLSSIDQCTEARRKKPRSGDASLKAFDTRSKVFGAKAGKALMMSCLFYVLAHNDTRKYLGKTIFKSIGDKYYLFGAMVIFFVLYYLINLFL